MSRTKSDKLTVYSAALSKTRLAPLSNLQDLSALIINVACIRATSRSFRLCIIFVGKQFGDLRCHYAAMTE